MDILCESNPKLVKLIKIANSRYSKFINKHKDLPITSELTPYTESFGKFIQTDYSNLTKEQILKLEEDFHDEVLDLLQMIEDIEEQIQRND